MESKARSLQATTQRWRVTPSLVRVISSITTCQVRLVISGSPAAK